MISPGAVRRLKESQSWDEVTKHIQANIRALDTVSDIVTGDAHATDVEVRARQLTMERLREILKPFTGEEDVIGDRRADTLAAAGLE